ncbi:MAG: hypothetical protein RIF41_29775, partial [Polyangiaceae bacterium]
MSARRVPRSAPRKPRRRPGAGSPTERRPPKKPAAPKRAPRKRPKSGSPARRRKPARGTTTRKATQLSLSGRGTWGGYRAGAGRKRIARDVRGYVPHTRRPKVTKSTPVHATL